MQPIDGVSAGHLKEATILLLAGFGVLAGLAGIVLGILKLTLKRPTEVQPQPLAVRGVPGWVDQATFDREHNMVLARLTKVEQNYQDLREIIAEQAHTVNTAVGSVHRRVDDLVKVTYAVAGKLGIKAESRD